MPTLPSDKTNHLFTMDGFVEDKGEMEGFMSLN